MPKKHGNIRRLLSQWNSLFQASAFTMELIISSLMKPQKKIEKNKSFLAMGLFAKKSLVISTKRFMCLQQ
jgi:hypothetical protein